MPSLRLVGTRIISPAMLSWEPQINDHQDANPPLVLENPNPWGWEQPAPEMKQVTKVIAY